MLEELHVSGLGVIEDAMLELDPGLNVLTGETGAGKTMITVGLALALGARAASSVVRTGHRAALVEARFSLDSSGWPMPEVLADADGSQEGPRTELVLARSVGAEGKGSARLDGRLAPVSVLAEIGASLVEVHGQNQATRLLTPAAQTAFLDRFAGPDHLAVGERYRGTLVELRSVRARLEALDRDVREREREKDLLEYQIREIESARVQVGELRALAEEESRLAHADRILGLASTAERSIGDEGGAADGLRAAAAAAQAIATLDPGAFAVEERLRSAATEAVDALEAVRAYRESVEVDPARLGSVQERLRALKDLERKYGDGEEGILAYLTDATARLGSLEGRDAERDALEGRAGELAAQAEGLAATLGEARAVAAPRLAAALTREARALGMPGAEVTVGMVRFDQLQLEGAERAELGFRGGPGQPQLPLARAASGGELSRLMLACRAVLAELDEIPTLVFDEVDVGIGGRTATAVAERLAAVARTRQVVVVTHLAQIAARADRHFLVTKAGGSANVRPVEGDDRVEELARMLSGRTGRASLAHARELIETVAG